MAFAQINLQQIINSPHMQRQINTIRHMGELRLTEAIWDNVYSAHKTDYKRTYELLHSVSSSFKITGDTIEIKVFCDPDKMNHYSLVDGRQAYIPALINYGFSWHGMESYTEDYFHSRPSSKFLEKAMEQIQNDINSALISAVVMAINSNRYR